MKTIRSFPTFDRERLKTFFHLGDVKFLPKSGPVDLIMGVQPRRRGDVSIAPNDFSTSSMFVFDFSSCSEDNEIFLFESEFFKMPRRL